jgi:hypothetical protein
MVESGILVVTSNDRQIEYIRVYGDTVIVAGSETAAWGGKMPNAGKTEHLRFTAIWMKQGGRWQEVAPPCQHRASAMTKNHPAVQLQTAVARDHLCDC